MKRIRNIFIGTVLLFALGALPMQLDFADLGYFDLSSAYARGNGNGGGSGGGNGNGGGNGRAEKGEKGKSASAKDRSGSLFGKERRATAFKDKKGSSRVKTAKAERVRGPRVAALPASVELPEAKPIKEKNFRAKLAGLNSLNRNYHAYLNSQAPRMASIQAFVMASAQLDIATAELEAANSRAAAAQAAFDSLLSNTEITPYDDAVGIYDDPTLKELEDRLEHLNSVTVAPEDEEALEAEVTALEGLLGSSEAMALAEAEKAAADAQLAADEAAAGTDDEALREALLDAANENRIEQYGDDYVDDEVMDWAKDVLGVGDDFGKIDEVRESLEASE
jgi:hypothetical protein